MYKFAFAMAAGLMIATPAMAAPPEDCTGACEEGYLWAQDNDITTPEGCLGKPVDFAEGCRAYLDDATGGGTDDDNDME